MAALTSEERIDIILGPAHGRALPGEIRVYSAHMPVTVGSTLLDFKISTKLGVGGLGLRFRTVTLN